MVATIGTLLIQENPDWRAANIKYNNWAKEKEHKMKKLETEAMLKKKMKELE